MNFDKALNEKLKTAKDKRSCRKIIEHNYEKIIEFKERGYRYTDIADLFNDLGLKINGDSIKKYIYDIKKRKKEEMKNIDNKVNKLSNNGIQDNIGESSSDTKMQNTDFYLYEEDGESVGSKSIKEYVEKSEKIDQEKEQTNRASKGVEGETDKENSSQGNVISTEEKLAKMVEDSGWYEEAYSYDLSSLSEEEREVAEYIYCGIPYTADGEPCVDGNVGISQKVSDKVLKYKNKYNK